MQDQGKTEGSVPYRRSCLSRRRLYTFVLALLVGIVLLKSQGIYSLGQLAAQEGSAVTDEGLDDEAISEPAPVPVSEPPSERQNLISRLLDAGIGWLILFFVLSLVTMFFIIEHSLTIRKGKLMPEYAVGELEQKVARGEVQEAIEFCHQAENYSLTSEVILAGLERYQGSEFGFAEYKTAVEEEGENQTARLYRKTEVLGVIGAIAPMLGLLGTVQGMIISFYTIAEKNVARPADLAHGVGTALITTLLGLIVAIPAMIAFSFFRNKIDSLVAEIGKRVERLLMPLGRKR